MLSTLNKKVGRDLWRMRGEVLAIILVLGAGVAVFVMGLGTVDSLEVTRKTYYQRYHFAEIFMTMRRAPETLAEKLEAIPGIQQVTTSIAHNAVLEVEGIDEPLNGLLVSAPEQGENSLNNIHIRQGRMLQPNSTHEVVVTEPFAATNHLLPGSTLYATLKGQRRQLQVVGIALSPEYVFFSVPGTMAPDDRRFGVLWMSRTALGDIFDLNGAFNNLALSLQPGANENDVIQQLDRLFLNYGGVGAYGRADHMSHATLSGEIAQVRASIYIAAPIFLGVVAFLLNMLMLRYIETERRHIGTLKAFGYTNGQVAWHYTLFVLLIVAVGLSLGIATGAWLGRSVTEAYAAHYHFPFLEYTLRPVIFCQAAIVFGVAGLLGAYASVNHALSLEPAVAMRPAPPPSYRHNPLQRRTALSLLDQPTRMIFRHIFRWSTRSMMTITGIAAATSTFIAPFGISSSVEQMIQTHFFQAERQDLTIAFAQERPLGALIDLEAYPGVLAVEPFRAVLANIRFKAKVRRVTILGRKLETRLARSLDTAGQALKLPTHGVVMSSTMADWLGVKPGDSVTLEFLQGHRLTREVPITAISASYVGLTFFTLNMELSALNNLMLESNVMSGVNLKFDRNDSHALYQKLKQTPSISGVIAHDASLATMRRLLSETLKMVVINGVFAAAIIVGVIYNNTRISFTERCSDFATMLMLGFSRFEIYYVGLGELMLLAMAALPLGCLGGWGFALLLTEGTANEVFRVPLHLTQDAFGKAIVFTFGTVFAASLAMLKQIIQLDIVDTLKANE